VVDFYTPGGMKVPGVPNAYILLPTNYFHWDTDERGRALPATIDVSFATSRDLASWWRPAEPEPFLRFGLDGTAGTGMVFSNPWPIAVGDEIWFYYAGLGGDHRGGARRAARPSAMFRARMRRDGFVSADAGYRGGEFTTPVVTFAGRRLELSVDGSAGGWLQVEVLSAGGRPVAGYRLGQCDTIMGNALDKKCTWRGKSGVSKLAGKSVRLRFVMRSMKLFAFQFAR